MAKKYPIDFVVDDNGCFNCTSHKAGKRGYPRMRIGIKEILVFRFVYGQMFEPLQEGDLIRHLCDNKLCINPEHLRKGTQKENMRDALRNGRLPLGSQRANAKLDELKASAIKTLLDASDFTCNELGLCFGVSDTTIEQIRDNKTWKHVTTWKAAQ
jgi:hypothetical protein